MIKTLAYISSLSILIPLIVGIFRIRITEVNQIFFLLISITSIVELLNSVLSYYQWNNIWLVNSYDIVQVTMVGILFIKYYGMSILWTRFFGITLVILVSTMILVLLNFGFFNLNQMNAVIASVFTAIISMSILYWLFSSANRSFARSSIFWIASGLLIYSCTTVVVYGLANTMFKMGSNYILIYTIFQMSINIVTNIIYSIAFLCRK